MIFLALNKEFIVLAENLLLRSKSTYSTAYTISTISRELKLLAFRFKCIIFSLRSILVLDFYNVGSGIIKHSVSLVKNQENYTKLQLSHSKLISKWFPKLFTFDLL